MTAKATELWCHYNIEQIKPTADIRHQRSRWAVQYQLYISRFGLGLFFSSLSTVRCPSGCAGFGYQVDQRVTGLSKFCDGHAASLSDELSHWVQLLWCDGDELPSVVNHSCKKENNNKGYVWHMWRIHPWQWRATSLAPPSCSAQFSLRFSLATRPGPISDSWVWFSSMTLRSNVVYCSPVMVVAHGFGLPGCQNLLVIEN